MWLWGKRSLVTDRWREVSSRGSKRISVQFREFFRAEGLVVSVVEVFVMRDRDGRIEIAIIFVGIDGVVRALFDHKASLLEKGLAVENGEGFDTGYGGIGNGQ